MRKGRRAEVSVLEAAGLLGRRLDSTYRLIWERRLEAHKENGVWWVSTASVQRFRRAVSKRKRAIPTRRANREARPSQPTATAGA